ncbi:carbohydrate kinase family protein [Rathayibacter caricis]|uniref:carbohydrate kinase family protein n=1 Tax=Rathayibacter caricis TaxID=110936 RepID=UPI001FB4DC23|nr:carbohydrate kinase family protein [Rathayibacter caricis]MCJ1697360.1 carbohydrate kinase family protein [Rathayibacter caricis]
MDQIAVLSHIVLDEVHPADSDSHTEVGGAGAYAAVGASLAGRAGSAVLVSGVGSADRAAFVRWCSERGIDSAGLFDVGEHGPRTVIRYSADGERVETPVHGPAHFHAHTPLPRHLPASVRSLAGVYLFHDHDPEYWDEIAASRAQWSGPVLWEIAADACRTDALPAVLERLASVDVLSINRTEVLSLFGAAGIGAAVAELSRLDVTTVLRLGAGGSLVVEGGGRAAVTAVGIDRGAVVDPTGGGNSYSGAFLASFAASGDPVAAARLATAVAAAVIAQPGAPLVDDPLRERVRRRASLIPLGTP